MTLDGGDHRFCQLHSGGPHGPVALGLQLILVLATAHCLQVGAGTETASTIKHRHPRLRIFFEVPKRLRQRRGRRSVHGIADCGSIENDGGHCGIGFHFH